MNIRDGTISARPARRPRRFSRRLQLYIFLDILKLLILIFLGFQVVLGSIFAIKVVRDYGVDMGILLPLMAPALAASLNAALPVSLLFATTLVYGRLIADREIAAMKSFGCSYGELAFLPGAFGAILSVGVLLLNFYVIPDLRFTRDNLGGIILDRIRYLGEGEDQSFELGKTHTLWIESYDGSLLKGIFIASEAGSAVGVEGIDPNDDSPEKVNYLSYPFFLYAEEGEVVSGPEPGAEAIYIELRDISIFFDSEYIERNVSTNFKQRVNLGKLRLPVLVEESNKNIKEQSLPALKSRIKELHRQREEARAREVSKRERERIDHTFFVAVTEFHRRINFALVAMTFPLAGVCLALFLNSPNRLLPVFVSLMVIPPIFYVLEMWGNSLAHDGYLPAFWEELGNVALLSICAGLFLALRKRTLW